MGKRAKEGSMNEQHLRYKVQNPIIAPQDHARSYTYHPTLLDVCTACKAVSFRIPDLARKGPVELLKRVLLMVYPYENPSCILTREGSTRLRRTDKGWTIVSAGRYQIGVLELEDGEARIDCANSATYTMYRMKIASAVPFPPAVLKPLVICLSWSTGCHLQAMELRVIHTAHAKKIEGAIL